MALAMPTSGGLRKAIRWIDKRNGKKGKHYSIVLAPAFPTDLAREHAILSIAGHVHEILKLVGENADREGLKETPKRYAKMLLEMFSGLDPRNEPKVTLFKNTEGYDEMVCETDIEFHSICEHHLVPFVGRVHMGYVPRKNGYYVGLSKLARIVDYYAHRPQVQERLTCQIADWIFKALNPLGCIVVVEAEHLCMSMRGVKKPRHLTTTSALRGIMRKDPNCMQEFFSILAARKHS